MPQYRMLFLDGRGSIEAIDQFEADNDEIARTASAAVWNACSDTYSGYVLWSLSRRLASVRNPKSEMDNIRLDTLPKKIQRLILEREEILHERQLRLAKSKRLQEALSTLRHLLSAVVLAGTICATDEYLRRSDPSVLPLPLSTTNVDAGSISLPDHASCRRQRKRLPVEELLSCERQPTLGNVASKQAPYDGGRHAVAMRWAAATLG